MLPVALMREFEAIAARYGAKRKWMVLAAALKLLIEAPDEKREQYVRQIASADLGGDEAFEAMVRQIKEEPAFGKLVYEKPVEVEEARRKKDKGKVPEAK